MAPGTGVHAHLLPVESIVVSADLGHPDPHNRVEPTEAHFLS